LFFLALVGIQPGKRVSLDRTVFLLGMIRGHWDYSGKNLPIGYGPTELKAVNMGMAVVTPIQEITKVLLGKKFSSERLAEDGERLRKHAPKND
jgi:hypothetical protein